MGAEGRLHWVEVGEVRPGDVICHRQETVAAAQCWGLRLGCTEDLVPGLTHTQWVPGDVFCVPFSSPPA